MTTITLPRATVEQALEALENWRKGPHDSVTRRGNTTRSDVAIALLRAALAQQPKPPPPLWPPTGLEPRGCPLPGACSCPSESVRSTHSEDCWQWHQACAVAAVIRLRAEVARLSKRDGE